MQLHNFIFHWHLHYFLVVEVLNRYKMHSYLYYRISNIASNILHVTVVQL